MRADRLNDSAAPELTVFFLYIHNTYTAQGEGCQTFLKVLISALSRTASFLEIKYFRNNSWSNWGLYKIKSKNSLCISILFTLLSLIITIAIFFLYH